jgi:hypothetical protein
VNVIRFIALLVVLAGVNACVNETPPAPPGGVGGTDGAGGFDGAGGTGGVIGTGGTGGAGGQQGTGGERGTGGGAGATGQGGDGGTGGDGAGAGACNKQSDIDALMALLPNNARQVAAECGVSSQNEIAFEDLFTADVAACVEQDVTGLSSECAVCYGELAFCSGVTCLPSCRVNACSTDCLSCAGYDTCIDELTQCAGRMSTDCSDDT